jgi:hypothetical protein
MYYNGHMPPRKEREFPEWAEQERTGDLEWIGENLHVLWPAAQLGYEAVGRGAVVVDTTIRPTGEGHPFGYFDQQALEQGADMDTQRLVREYDPSWEMVTSLLKTEQRVSSYRVGVLSAEQREKLGQRVDPETPTDSPEQATTRAAQPPDLETLIAWESEGYCEATDGCVVEPDGTCPHGCQSWLLELGLI